MTATINYDKPIANFIDALSATGHVTHRSYKKTSVTLHHNGGRLSHQGVLNVWKTRPASAHFDVDGVGALAQYVKVHEYAWAVGNMSGNMSTISIEMADATLGPGWTVADATWKAAARLAAWLFYKEIGIRPSENNLFYHSHWSATDCAGPYMRKIYTSVLKETRRCYDAFVKAGKTPPPAPLPTTPEHDPKKSVTDVAKDVIKGLYGNGPERVRKLVAAGYNYKAVQAEVDRILHPYRGHKSVHEIASEVVAGKWGNDPKRSVDLKKAGYNVRDVQREVNKIMLSRKR